MSRRAVCRRVISSFGGKDGVRTIHFPAHRELLVEMREGIFAAGIAVDVGIVHVGAKIAELFATLGMNERWTKDREMLRRAVDLRQFVELLLITAQVLGPIFVAAVV